MRYLSFWSICALFALASCLGEPDPTFAEQLKSDISKIDQYLTANGITAIKDISGVRVVVQSLGTGYVPRLSDKVTVTYSGSVLNDGAVFDSGTLTDKNIAATSTSAGLIPGFQIGITMIPAGSTATIYIPSGYGYGQQALSGIPANSNLVFTVTLKKIKVTTTELDQLGADTVLIDDFIEDAAIADVVKDTSGLRYKITELGTGTTPGLYHKVEISYSGFLLTDGAKGIKFYQGTTKPSNETDSRVVNYIRGFQIGLRKLPKGSKATLYIPSGQAFGTQSLQSELAPIPANSILIYDVELVDVIDP